MHITTPSALIHHSTEFRKENLMEHLLADQFLSKQGERKEEEIEFMF